MTDISERFLPNTAAVFDLWEKKIIRSSNKKNMCSLQQHWLNGKWYRAFYLFIFSTHKTRQWRLHETKEKPNNVHTWKELRTQVTERVCQIQLTEKLYIPRRRNSLVCITLSLIMHGNTLMQTTEVYIYIYISMNRSTRYFANFHQS